MRKALLGVCVAAVLPTGAMGAVTAMTGGDAGQGLTLVPGDVVYAINPGDLTPATLQGVSFNTTDANISLVYDGPPGQTNYTGAGAFAGGEVSADDDAAEEIANAGTFANDGFGGSSINGTISGLTLGRFYRINQVISDSAPAFTRTQQFSYNGIPAAEFTTVAGSIYNVESVVLATSTTMTLLNNSINEQAIFGGLVVSDAGAFNLANRIVQVGADENVLDTIRTTSVPKDFVMDLDGDDAYGTDGAEFFGVTPTGNQGGALSAGFETNASINLPSYISDIAGVVGGLNQSARDFGYAQVDDPTIAVGPAVANVDSGVAFRSGVVPGDEYALFDIVFGANAPGLVRVGLFTDNEPVNQTAQSFRIAGVGGTLGNSGSMATVTANGQMDAYFFDIYYPQAGDTFRVFGVARASIGNIVISGVTFDSFDIPVLPEPASALLIGSGVLLLLRRGRRV